LSWPKTFAGQTSGKFVNGVFGDSYKQLAPEDQPTRNRRKKRRKMKDFEKLEKI